MKLSGELDEIITETVLSSIEIMETKVEHIATPEFFGAIGDGETDDYQALQNAINSGRKVVLNPEKKYTFSKIIFWKALDKTLFCDIMTISIYFGGYVI